MPVFVVQVVQQGDLSVGVEQRSRVNVILEYPATPNETLALSMAFSDAGIPARLRAAPRRRANESSVWRVVISTSLHELLTAFDVPKAALPQTLERLVARVAESWSQGPVGHIEVGARGRERRATGGVLLTPDLPPLAYSQLVRLASSTPDAQRLFLWDGDVNEWITFDADVPVGVPSGPERRADFAAERVERRFRRSV
jgi:hypothetical protein